MKTQRSVTVLGIEPSDGRDGLGPQRARERNRIVIARYLIDSAHVDADVLRKRRARRTAKSAFGRAIARGEKHDQDDGQRHEKEITLRAKTKEDTP
jgi:hypothetical protein